ncbi:methyl-accepting chemotaxis protein [Desulfosporosinus sp. PR]|uniref:methyl-accepting chemotaxis protein n=1 Tax=Candidatus Desulfosporosinus nitrosoreducens TaxID=3401928 RepID=UPI0027EC3AC9|nr:methyl-accepting chemotaxis protein [Desulfosporosinus sp. PR]MDQ7096537.1 methyl-accepting chemotaxis protein [Desulfosporosinus sp. PR]
MKILFSQLVKTYESGAAFFLHDREKLIFVTANNFTSQKFEIGHRNTKGGLADQIIESQAEKRGKRSAEVSGGRDTMLGGPIWADDKSSVEGCWILRMQHRHKLVEAFDQFAPIMTEMFTEGGLLFLSDKEKYVTRQGSKKFDIARIQKGAELEKTAVETIRSKKEITRDMPESVYGVPVQVSYFPLFDDDNSEVVGTFGLMLPRSLAQELKVMANTLGRGLTEVSAAMEEIAASASNVSDNQNQLNQEIKKVQELTEKIDQVMVFTKEVADQTKMLGLNAAIEAARAGDAGRGFGIVAEEIRKLSEESKQNALRIKELTAHISQSIASTTLSSAGTLETVAEVAGATQEVTATLEEMASLAEKLDKVAVSL